MRDENLPVLMFLNLLYRKVKWKLFYNEKRCLCWGFDDKFYNAFFYVVFLVFHRLCPALVVIVSCFTIGYKLMVLKWEREGERKETRDEIFFTKLNPTTFEGIKRWATFFYIFLKKIFAFKRHDQKKITDFSIHEYLHLTESEVNFVCDV